MEKIITAILISIVIVFIGTEKEESLDRELKTETEIGIGIEVEVEKNENKRISNTKNVKEGRKSSKDSFESTTNMMKRETISFIDIIKKIIGIFKS